FTHGITPAWVNHNRCFIKKCILMFRAMRGHLASKGKRAGGPIDGKGKKSRSGYVIMQDHLNKIVELSKKSQAAIESIAQKREDA
uniref:Uncharacterized protein n=1 Tax=Aegilops tauschii subsp. strangulata TaxID=200361 RepID=A0A453EUW7_AEGTS